jgi:ferritin-like metal-binding protein YciE
LELKAGAGTIGKPADCPENHERSSKMTHAARDVLVVGLRNAHAVESQAIELLERQASTLDDYPEIQTRVQEHLGETERQLERLEQALEMLREDTSAIKDAALSALGNFMAIANRMGDDAILKNSFASYSFEHYEIAAYESLLELAEMAGAREIMPLLQETLREERAMADWLANSVHQITRQYVQRRERKDRAA